jgi:hypothetical protein
VQGQNYLENPLRGQFLPLKLIFISLYTPIVKKVKKRFEGHLKKV